MRSERRFCVKAVSFADQQLQGRIRTMTRRATLPTNQIILNSNSRSMIMALGGGKEEESDVYHSLLLPYSPTLFSIYSTFGPFPGLPICPGFVPSCPGAPKCSSAAPGLIPVSCAICPGASGLGPGASGAACANIDPTKVIEMTNAKANAFFIFSHSITPTHICRCCISALDDNLRQNKFKPYGRYRYLLLTMNCSLAY